MKWKSKRERAPVATPQRGNITHIRKPGWYGVIYDHPWNMPLMVDVLWTEAPEDATIPVMPSRYPVKDLLVDGKPFDSADLDCGRNQKSVRQSFGVQMQVEDSPSKAREESATLF